jgi:hypothetical protein
VLKPQDGVIVFCKNAMTGRVTGEMFFWRFVSKVTEVSEATKMDFTIYLSYSQCTASAVSETVFAPSPATPGLQNQGRMSVNLLELMQF